MAAVPFEILNPDFSLDKIRILVFDLDDTLYYIPSGAQFYRYGEHLSRYLPEKERKAYMKEFDRAWSDGSPIKVGRAFDPETSWVLQFDNHWRVEKAYLIDGSQVPQDVARARYPIVVEAEELRGLIHFSSGWGVPSAVGRLHGLGREQFRAAYLATRKDMRDDPENFPLVVPDDLPPFFQRLYERGYGLIVMTNSDLGDSEEILEKLRIRRYFHMIYAEARKPNHSLPIFKEIVETSGHKSSNVMVAGDSVYNDLREAKSIGAQTVLVERFPNQPLGTVDVRVWDFEGFIRLWNGHK